MELNRCRPRQRFLKAMIAVGAALLIAVCGNAAAPDNAPARSVKKMKLKVSANGRYFIDQDGKPFFYLGDTCWLLFQRPNREEVDEYLKDRAAKGFTVIQPYVLRGLGKKHPDGNSSLLEATPLIDRDPARPNEEFFKNVDYVINRANELGAATKAEDAAGGAKRAWKSPFAGKAVLHLAE